MSENQKKEKDSPYLIPIAIVIAGAFIAGSIFLSGSIGQTETRTDSNTNGLYVEDTSEIKIRDIDIEKDHIRGNKNAEVTIVEFSDFECPFCQRFHETMKQVLDEYGDDVSWVYRHFPLTQINEEAQGAAIASECVASLSGNDAFWSFTDAIFENQSRLGAGLYNEIAVELGISSSEFQSCLSSSEMLNEVGVDVKEALDAGARGTPFSVILNKDGVAGTIPGSLPFEDVKSFIDKAFEI